MLTPGQVAFGNLPNSVQSRLLKRQQNKEEEQFQVKLSSVVWNYLFIVVLLCWYSDPFLERLARKPGYSRVWMRWGCRIPIWLG
jgi:hypothetical protein